MSWDVLLIRSDEPPAPAKCIPKGWRTRDLGTADDVRNTISDLLPGTDWSDPTWGHFDRDGFSFEFNMGDDDTCGSCMIHVRGGGDAGTWLLRLAQVPGWYLLDISQCEWLHHAVDVTEGWKTFQAFRNRALRHPLAEPDSD